MNVYFQRYLAPRDPAACDNEGAFRMIFELARLGFKEITGFNEVWTRTQYGERWVRDQISRSSESNPPYASVLTPHQDAGDEIRYLVYSEPDDGKPRIPAEEDLDKYVLDETEREPGMQRLWRPRMNLDATLDWDAAVASLREDLSTLFAIYEPDQIEKRKPFQ